MVLQLANTPQKCCAQEEEKRTLHTPTRGKLNDTAGDGNVSPYSSKERVFFSPGTFLLVSLAQIGVISAMQFHTDSSLPTLVTRQLLSYSLSQTAVPCLWEAWYILQSWSWVAD